MFEPLPAPSRAMRWAAPLLAIAATLVLGYWLFRWLGLPAITALQVFFVKPVSTVYGVGELLLKASPIMLCALGLAIGYRANVWNIGAEGQLTLGAICGGGTALALQAHGGPWLLPLMVVAGAAGGMAWAAIPAWLRTRCGANEILTSLMLVYIASLLLSYLVQGPWRDPDGYNFPQSSTFAPAALWPTLLAGTRLNLGALLAFAAVPLAWVFVARTLIGFQMRVAGASSAAAAYAGISNKRNVWVGLLVGGAAAGIAGVNEAAGPIGQLLPSMSPGYGFAAIIVAFVGRLHPLGIVLASILMSLLYLGGESVQIEFALPSAITGLFQGTLLFFLLAADVFVNYRLRVRTRAAPRRDFAGASAES